MTRIVHVSLLLFILIFGQKISTAQSCKSCFSELFLGITYIHAINSIPHNDIYTTPQFIGFKTGTDFLSGRIQLDVTHATFTSKLLYPKFDQYLITAGYQRQFKLPMGFSVGPGFRIGNAYMMFDMPNVVADIANESEFVAAGYLSLEKRLGNHFSLATGYSFNRIYTKSRIDWQWLEFHLYYYFKTPEGFKKWMD
jgi:hypothetical protein